MSEDPNLAHEMSPHYCNFPPGYEPIDIIERLGLNFTSGNVIKYILRARHKGGIQDLEKARWNLDRYIAQMKRDHAESAPP